MKNVTPFLATILFLSISIFEVKSQDNSVTFFYKYESSNKWPSSLMKECYEKMLKEIESDPIPEETIEMFDIQTMYLYDQVLFEPRQKSISNYCRHTTV